MDRKRRRNGEGVRGKTQTEKEWIVDEIGKGKGGGERGVVKRKPKPSARRSSFGYQDITLPGTRRRNQTMAAT